MTRVLTRLPFPCGVIAMALAVAALLGYAIDAPLLASLLPGGIAMKVNTAIGLALGALALLALRRAGSSRARWGLWCAAGSLALGLATLLQFVTGIDLGIDQWLVADPWPDGQLPGRPSVNAALNLVLLGAALLMLGSSRPRARDASQALALAGLLIASLSLLNQSYGGMREVGIGALDRMALSTAAAFLALSVGVLCARVDTGWMALFTSAGAGGQLMRTLLPVVILAPSVLGWLRVEGQELGVFDFRLGAALVAVASTAILALLVIWSAKRAEGIDRELRASQTALRAREQALRESEEFLQYQISRMPIGYVVWDTDFRVKAWNPAAESIFGYAAAQAMGKHACELILPESIPSRVDTLWAQLLAGPEVVRSVNANRTADGREILCDWTNAPLRRGGAVVGVLSMVQDVTQRRLAEEALRRNEVRLAETQRLARVGGWEYEVRTARLTWTDETYRIHGVDRDHGPGDLPGALQYFAPQHRELLDQAFRDAIGGAEPFDLELQLRTAPGELLWVRTVGQPEQFDGKVARVYGHIVDITARKDAEQAQQRYADRLRVVNRLDHVISSTFDLGTVYDILVDELKRLFLFDRTALIVLSPDRARWQIHSQWTRAAPVLQPRTWYEVQGSALEWLVENRRTYFVNDLAESRWAEDDALRAEGLRSRVVVPLMFRSEILGALTLNSATPAAYTAEDMAILEALADQVAIALNNARLYEQLQQQAALLERRVRERTAQLESAVKDLEGFSYSVSHDLRAPLRAIDSFSDIILQDYRDRLDDEGRRLLGIVRENTARMGRLIEDILAFSRAGRRELQRVEVDMRALVENAWDEIGAAPGSPRAELRIGPLPTVLADRTALRQVVVNLLSNASKFTRKRADAVVEVTALEDGDQSTFSVRDNGAGFDPHYRHKLFGVFQRLHDPEEFEGTGIGLAIVKRIVEKHGGRVWAEGQPDAGATFHFSLPRLTPGANTGDAHV